MKTKLLIAFFAIIFQLTLEVEANEDVVLQDLLSLKPDLVVPEMTDEKPAAGKRVRQQSKKFLGSNVYHTLYLPTDWKQGKKYPVIVEYAGNKWKTSLGTVEGSSLGYGVSAGQGVIWICMPYVDLKKQENAPTWWGDVDATVEYCKETVERVCSDYGGDSSNVFIAGFSRGAIACNYIGLHDDVIASLWKGFICHSHYDGIKSWSYENSDRQSALKRIERLGNRAQFISQENSVFAIKKYLSEVYPDGDFNFVTLPYPVHTDKWVLRNIPERKILRKWFWNTVAKVDDSKKQEFKSIACKGSYSGHLQGATTNEKDAIYWSFTKHLVKTNIDGIVLKKIEVQDHHGDICYANGKIYVAVNFGQFNDIQERANSWVYIYDADDLSLFAKHKTKELVYGAGGIAHHNGRFIVVGGLPKTIDENYAYEYDSDFKFIKRHVLKSGQTLMGIQTAEYAEGYWWFGCYGRPSELLKVSQDFQHVEKFKFNCSLAIVRISKNMFLVGSGVCSKENGCIGSLHKSKVDSKFGLIRLKK